MKYFFKSKGFTLVELLIVISLISALSGGLILLINPKAQFDKTKDSQRQSDINQIQKALELYYEDTNCYPTTGTVPFGSSWDPYMKKVPQDPDSASPYTYTPDSSACPQWNVLFAKLTRAPATYSACSLPADSPCVPPGYDNSYYCAISGNTTCTAPEPTPTSGPLPTSTPTPVLPTPTPTPVGPTPTPTPALPTPTATPAPPTPTPTPMPPPVLDTTSSTFTSGGTGATSLTWSHTVSGTNRLLVVEVAIQNNASQTVTSVTYAGMPLSSIGALNNGTNVRTEMWGLLAPPTGANSVQVTLSSSASFTAGSASFTGVSQTTPLGTFSSTSGNSTNPSLSVTSSTNELVVDVLAAGAQGQSTAVTATPTAGQTQLWNAVNSCGGCAKVRGAGSYRSGGVVTMSWTLSDIRPWAIGAVPVKP